MTDAMRIADRLSQKIQRTCRYLNHCRLCDKPITFGQRYHDGGFGNRAHVECVVEALGKSLADD